MNFVVIIVLNAIKMCLVFVAAGLGNAVSDVGGIGN